MRSRTLRFLTVLLFLLPSIARSEPVVTGCQVTVYATVPYPQSFTFAPDGTIYAGSDSHQGDTHPDPVFRIAPGGAPVAEYGAQYFYDPDGVLCDADGSATGVAGGLLVSDWNGGSASSALRLIHPDESTTTWAASGQPVKNPTYVVKDSTGAVWATDDYRYQAGLVRVIDGTANVIVPGPAFGFWGIALSPAGTVFVSACADGASKTIREYDLDGNLLQADFATSAAYDILGFGQGGAFGMDLYALSTGGDLYRLDPTGSATWIGGGFHTPVDLKFGPDGNMYVSEDSEGRILKVVPDVSAVEPWTGTPALRPGSVSAAPNPSWGETAIRLDLARTERAIDVGIFDLSGRLVRSLHSGALGQGGHMIPWDGLDTGGRRAADGIYLVRVQGQGLRLGTKIVLLR